MSVLDSSIQPGDYGYRFKGGPDSWTGIVIHMVTPDRALALCTVGSRAPEWASADWFDRIELKTYPVASLADTPSSGYATTGPSFQPGDVVRLKSGGPMMTVLRSNSDTVICVYQETTSQWELITQDVPAIVLELMPVEKAD